MASGYKPFNVDSTILALQKAGRYTAGRSLDEQRRLITKTVASDIGAEAIRYVQGRWPNGTLKNSIGTDWTHTTAQVFTDRNIAPHGAIVERGGVIKAYKSKFRKWGQPNTPQLFIPLKKNIRPSMAKTRKLKFGIDYILTPRVKRTGTFFLKNAFKRRLQDRGASPLLASKLGFSMRGILKRGGR